MEELAEAVRQMQYKLASHIQLNETQFGKIEARLSDLSTLNKETIMSDMPEVKINNNPSDPMAAAMAMMAGNRGGDGMFGGAGMLGGLVLGTLLRGGNLLNGGVGEGAAVSQPQANMSIMAGIGDLKQAVAVSTAQMETSQALQSSTIQAQISAGVGAINGSIAGVKDVVNSNTVALMQMINGVQAAITTDGEKTRALITGQYEATLNRQLSDANAAIIELRSQQTANAAARTAEINVTQNVNQLQQQQQQQAHFDRLTGVLLDVAQNIRATNQAINIGAGTLTANPLNTNTNVRT